MAHVKNVKTSFGLGRMFTYRRVPSMHRTDCKSECDCQIGWKMIKKKLIFIIITALVQGEGREREIELQKKNKINNTLTLTLTPITPFLTLTLTLYNPYPI